MSHLLINYLNVLLSCFIIKQIECTFTNVQSCSDQALQERLFYDSTSLPVDRGAPLQPHSSFWLFPVLPWEHEEVGDQRQDNAVLLFRVLLSEGFMFPHYLQFPEHLEAVCPLGWTLPSAFQLSGFLVEGQKWALGWLCSSCSFLRVGNVRKSPKLKQIPNLWAFPTLWALVVKWEGSQVLVSLCHLLEVGAGLGASLSHIPLMTDIFQFKKKNKGCLICRTRHWENSVCDQWQVKLLRQRKLFPLVLSWDSKISQR